MRPWHSVRAASIISTSLRIWTVRIADRGPACVAVVTPHASELLPDRFLKFTLGPLGLPRHCHRFQVLEDSANTIEFDSYRSRESRLGPRTSL